METLIVILVILYFFQVVICLGMLGKNSEADNFDTKKDFWLRLIPFFWLYFIFSLIFGNLLDEYQDLK